MNIKQIASLVGIVVVLLLVALGASLVSNKMNPKATVSLPPSPILGAIATSSDTYQYVDNQPYYTVNVVFPARIPLAEPVGSKIERTIEQGIADDIVQFKKDGNFANLTADDIKIQGLGADRKYAYGATYQFYHSATTDTGSYAFLVYEDTLGAHPNSFYQTFTFDSQGNQLTLADLFKPNSKYLNTLSALAYKGIVEQLKTKTGSQPSQDMLDTARVGTEPSPEALQFYYVDDQTLHLLFPPYQVAAYAAGAFDVAIPLASLTDILKQSQK